MLLNLDATMNFNVDNKPIIHCESLIKANAWIYFEHETEKLFKFKRIELVAITEQEVGCYFYSGSLVTHNGTEFLPTGNGWKAIDFIDFRIPNATFNNENFCQESLNFILESILTKYGNNPTTLTFSFEEGLDFITDTTMFRRCVFPLQSMGDNRNNLTHWLFTAHDGESNGHLILDKRGFQLIIDGASTNPITEIIVGDD